MKKHDNHIPTLTIGNVAKMLGISAESIRLYERKGLLLTDKTKGNQRLFSKTDVKRIECIITAINEHKISIEGMRRMQSLIPCWDHMRCSSSRRQKCPAYNRADAGCWTYKHKKDDCGECDCRVCDVYLLSGDCEEIRKLIHHTVSA